MTNVTRYSVLESNGDTTHSQRDSLPVQHMSADNHELPLCCGALDWESERNSRDAEKKGIEQGQAMRQASMAGIIRGIPAA